MENASKALLIAAGVLVGLIVISLIVLVHRQISSYYNEKEQAKIVEQVSDFNKEYIPYNRDDVRGSDLLSLINKIEDFNKLNPDEEKISISIKINNAKLFYYNYDKNNNIKLIELRTPYTEYTEETIDDILNEANRIETTYTQAKAKKLSEKIFTLMKAETEYENAEIEREQLFSELKMEYNKTKLKEYQEDILKYYQYIQFKRAHFDCRKLEYTHARVKSFEFEFNGKFE